MSTLKTLQVIKITLALCIFSYVSCAQSDNFSRLDYPENRISNVSDNYHGTIVKDPYRWLEKLESQETQTWVDEQEILLKEFLSNMPAKEYIEDRLFELKDYDLFTVPQKRGEDYYYLKLPAGEDRASLMVENKKGSNEVLLDPDDFFGDEQKNIPYRGLPGFFVSNSGSKIALIVANGPSRWYSVRVFIPDAKKLTEDKIEGIYNTSKPIIWDESEEGFYYVRFEREGGESNFTATSVSPNVYYHRLGTSQQQDQLIYESEEKSEILYLAAARERNNLVIHSRKGSGRVNKVLIADMKKGTPQIINLIDKEDAFYSYLGNLKDTYWFYTDLDAPNGRIVAINLSGSGLEEVVPEAEEPISGGSLVGGNALGLFGDTFVIMYTKDGVPFIRGFSSEGELKYEQDLPIDGSVWGGFHGMQDQEEFYFQFLGFTDPSSIYVVNAGTGERYLHNRSQINFNSDDYITKQVFYESKDGTRIPMFVSHKKGLELNGENPAFIYGYGALGWNSFLWYQPHLIVWLEQGGIYAQPSIRGGGEYGKEWHEAGVGLNRQNAMDDFIAGAEWLVRNKYTSPEKLALNGGSTSGSLAGIVMIQRPELFRAAVIDRPSLDMVRYSQFTVAKHWTQEFGSPENKEEFEVLYKLSPYHNIEPDVCYPSTLVMAGELDEVTPPFHAYKFIAKLQNTVTECYKPYMLKIMRKTGHTFGATPELEVDSRTAELLFLFKTMGVEVEPIN